MWYLGGICRIWGIYWEEGFALGLGLSTVKPVLLVVGGVAVLCGPAHSLALGGAMLRLCALSFL